MNVLRLDVVVVGNALGGPDTLLQDANKIMARRITSILFMVGCWMLLFFLNETPGLFVGILVFSIEPKTRLDVWIGNFATGFVYPFDI